ncbi:hypothetical protein PF005_g21088 [Phytophthora fragariae]|uniref:Pectate lyase n=1 Tax=Phytophthora fragariae TaxID=53985 RepID=A0A6A3Y2G1_9STRA|nr:hypothetical protein PF003_g33414 [Phytophthora fragariae]KAE8944400.1 hypothetical protein PF009_g5920 [Phytophthora fragariae]KAE9002960.1 hypothetical protein PF011_g13093 [Phytophthora fragariae]KAE9062210.1 hypothetical protein PF007_g29995 [Phytophthora fragariae]KAE9083971.1 hypothetical protein PF006_g26571 [Phytophthora fragariae]
MLLSSVFVWGGWTSQVGCQPLAGSVLLATVGKGGAKILSEIDTLNPSLATICIKVGSDISLQIGGQNGCKPQ